jgi:hypothetical protein
VSVTNRRKARGHWVVTFLASWMFLTTFASASLRGHVSGQNEYRSEEVTVRGTLARTGKAGDLFTLTLDQPLQVHDPGERNPETTVTLRLQYAGFEGKHVELTGKLRPAFGPGTAEVVVKAIHVVDDLAINSNDVQRQLDTLIEGATWAAPRHPTSILPFSDWEPVPLALAQIETVDGIRVEVCIKKDESATPEDKSSLAEQCSRKSETALSPREAAQILTEWVVAPRDVWFDHFSHTGLSTRSLEMRQSKGKDFVLELQPYGVGILVFDDCSGVYMVSRYNAAAVKPKNSQPSDCGCQPQPGQRSLADGQDKDPDQRLLRQAQYTVDQFLARFHQTLDLGPALDEFGLEDQRQMAEALATGKLCGNSTALKDGICPFEFMISGLDEKFARKVSLSDIRRFSIAVLNLFYLFNDLPFATCKNNDEACYQSRFAEAEGLLGPELSAADPVKDEVQLQDSLKKVETRLSRLRAMFPRGVFESEVYRENMKRFAEHEFPAKFSTENASIEGTTGKVIIAGKDLFSFWLVERNGEVKIWKIGAPWND